MLIRIESSLGVYWIKHKRIIELREVKDDHWKYVISWHNGYNVISGYTNVSPKDVNDAVRKFYAECGWDGK